MTLGDKIVCPTAVGRLTGTVIYIHPEGRFFAARFPFRRKGLFGRTETESFCECFPMRRRGA